MPHQSLKQKGISAETDRKEKAEMMDKKERVLRRGERSECQTGTWVRPGQSEKEKQKNQKAEKSQEKKSRNIGKNGVW
jgi:hypothetical protein